MSWPIVALIALIALAIGLFAGYLYRKNGMEKKIGQTEEFVANMLEDATHKAEEKKKEAVLEAKEEIIRLKSELDKEVRDRRSEVSRLERRVNQREEAFDKKLDNLEAREEALNDKYKEAERMEAEAAEMHARQKSELERVAGMTSEEAKQILIDRVQKDAYHDAAVMVREVEAKAKEEADKRARDIVSLAIQKCAADHVAETTVSVVALPNDDMKGRIIGREGRNIRTLETATGVDLIIDDTPEAVIISAFDPVRREVARVALEKLIAEGRQVFVVCPMVEENEDLPEGLKSAEEHARTIQSALPNRRVACVHGRMKAKDKEEAKAAAKKRRQEAREAEQRAKEEALRREQEKLDELSEMIEKQGGKAKFKPRIMTYNDMTQDPTLVEKEKPPKTEEPAEEPAEEPMEDMAEEAPADEETGEAQAEESLPDADFEPVEKTDEAEETEESEEAEETDEAKETEDTEAADEDEDAEETEAAESEETEEKNEEDEE